MDSLYWTFGLHGLDRLTGIIMSTSVLLTREKQVMFGIFYVMLSSSDSISLHDGSPGVTKGRNSVT